MRAPILVDLLLELNVINVHDIDREMNQLAAGVYDPRAAGWFKRVARYFIINIDQLLDPQKVKTTELRGGRRHQDPGEGAPMHIDATKYHLHPSGKWLGTTAPQHRSEFEFELGADNEWKKVEKKYPVPPEKNVHGNMPSDLKPEEWDTQFHQPAIQKDIERSFTPFNPKSPPAEAKRTLFGPPSKKEFSRQTGAHAQDCVPGKCAAGCTFRQPYAWMKGYKGNQTKMLAGAPGTPEGAKSAYADKMFHFDPVVVRRRELFLNLYDTVNYFNWVYELTKVYERIKKLKNADLLEKQQGYQAVLLMRALASMTTADVVGFNEVMQQTRQYVRDVEADPEKFIGIKPALILQMENGYRWLKMTTVGQLQREGKRVNHCVGNATYTGRLEAGTHDYFSLRDASGIPHATIEVRKPDGGGQGGSVLQVKGHSNGKPAPEYQPYLWPFFQHMHFTLAGDQQHVDAAEPAAGDAEE